MGTISRKQISEIKPINGEPLFVPAWNGTVNIRKWSGKQRAMLLVRVTEVYGQDNVDKVVTNGAEAVKDVKINTQDFPAMYRLMSEVIAISLCDDDAITLYDSKDEKDLEEIESFDAELLDFLFTECANRNGLLEGKVKEEIKN